MTETRQFRRIAPRSLLLCALAIAFAAAAQAQRLRVPIEISADEPMACSTARMLHLEGRDPVLAVRAGPSRRDRIVARLSERDPVFACGRRGDWFAIVFDVPASGRDCDVQRRWRAVGVYRGPCRSGWVHTDHIGEYADWISP